MSIGDLSKSHYEGIYKKFHCLASNQLTGLDSIKQENTYLPRQAPESKTVKLETRHTYTETLT